MRKDLIIFKIWKIKMNEWTEWGKKAKNFYFLIILNKFNNSEFTKTSSERWKQKHTSHTQVNKKKKWEQEIISEGRIGMAQFSCKFGCGWYILTRVVTRGDHQVEGRNVSLINTDGSPVTLHRNRNWISYLIGDSLILPIVQNPPLTYLKTYKCAES